MAHERQEKPDDRQSDRVLTQRRGIPVYRTNPSVPSPDGITKRRQRRIGDEHKGLLLNTGTGEVIGGGAAVVYEWEEVDQERFVKLFIGGLKKASGLSKAGLAIFEVVYGQMREKPNNDEVQLSFWIASDRTRGLNQRTYQRGLRELLEREILFRSPAEGTFFVDIQCMFNGDRLAFVKGYHLKGSETQAELPLVQPDEVRKAG